MDPLSIVEDLISQARTRGDPAADYAALTTVGAEGLPTSRMITVRAVRANAVYSDINAESPKGQDLSQRPDRWELLWFFPTLMTQIRLRGVAELQHSQEVRHAWGRKRKESQLIDIYHAEVRQQSSVIDSRATLEREVAELRARLPSTEAWECPASVIGLVLRPDFVEFWQGSLDDRLHQRRRFVRLPEGWSEQVLVP
jgi:pyridoxamine 5'-phosphate oxidase